MTPFFEFVVFSDLQFDNFESFRKGSLSEIHPESRLQICKSALRYISTYCQNHNIPTITCCGDLIDRKSNTPPRVLYHLKQELDHLVSNGRQLHILSGNHDYIDRRSTMSLLKVYESPSVRVYEISDSLVLRNGSDALQLIFAPDVETNVVDISRLASTLDPSQASILFAHIGIGGARMSKHIISESSVKVSDLSPDKFDLMFLGDYHGRQCLIPDKCWYVGALLQKNFGFEGDPQGFAHVRVYPGKRFEVIWVELPSSEFPEFKTIGLTDPIPKDFRGYLRVKSDTPAPLPLIRAKESELASLGLPKSLVDVPIEVAVSTPRIKFETDSPFKDRCFKYIETKCPPSLDVATLKSKLTSYLS